MSKLDRIILVNNQLEFHFKGSTPRIVPEVTTGLTITTGNAQLQSTTVAGSIAGKFFGPGTVPIGGVIGINPHLAGAYNCTATTVADAQGYVQCNGQTISDPTSHLNGMTVPNINGTVFLAGNTTAGTTGGLNSNTLTIGNLPPHVHPVDHAHTISSCNSCISTSGDNGAGASSDATPGSFAASTSNTADATPSTATGSQSANHAHSATTTTQGDHFHPYWRIALCTFTMHYAPGTDGAWDGALCTVDATMCSAGSHTHPFTVGTISADHQHCMSHCHSMPHAHNDAHCHVLANHVHDYTHTHSVSGTSFSGSSGPGAFADTAYDNRPSYMSVKYIIRIK